MTYTGTVNRGRRAFEVMDDGMVEVLKGKTPTERLEIAFAMWRSTRDLLTAMLAGQHPDWTDDRVADEAARRLSHGAC